MMRHRLATLAVALTAVLGTWAAVATGPAQATTPSLKPHKNSNPPWAGNYFGPVKFDLYDPNYYPEINCIVTNGPGNQLTIKNPAGNYCARINGQYDLTLIVGNNQYNTYWLTDASGHCLRGSVNNTVYPTSGPCANNDLRDLWALTSCYQSPPPNCALGYATRWRWENVGQNLWLKTDGDINGWKVWLGTGGSNEWDLNPG